jgi:hypothetical protein
MYASADLDPLYDTDGAAAYLGGDKPLSGRTLEKWRREGIGPTFVVLGSKCVRYRRSALDAFIDEGSRTSTSGGR